MKNLSSMLRRIFTGKFPAYSPPVDVYLGLRNLIFSSRPPGWMATARPTDLWGVLMETGYSSGVATLVALADDTVSLYYSTGGGAIGLGPNDGPRRAAQLLLRTAPRFLRELQGTRSYPLPPVAEVRFYFLTRDETSTANIKENELGSGRHALSPLFHVAHALISEIRSVVESQQATAK